MTPQKRRALLIENKITQTSIAKELGVTHSAVNRVLNGDFVSTRIRKAVAEKTRTPFDKMWGKAA